MGQSFTKRVDSYWRTSLSIHETGVLGKALARACRLRPNDHTAAASMLQTFLSKQIKAAEVKVWNKLGATLANSGKSEQAVARTSAKQGKSQSQRWPASTWLTWLTGSSRSHCKGGLSPGIGVEAKLCSQLAPHSGFTMMLFPESNI